MNNPCNNQVLLPPSRSFVMSILKRSNPLFKKLIKLAGLVKRGREEETEGAANEAKGARLLNI
uniref:Uncharacterized protein n=1 Tax=Physcomitrium patens TaxID=3218 RepID=A0A2K1ISV4_PHYPA|nr:hypothetical protein PHYPA_026482 [Physcomitrium patens]